MSLKHNSTAAAGSPSPSRFATEVDDATLAYFAGIAPTGTNAELISNLRSSSSLTPSPAVAATRRNNTQQQQHNPSVNHTAFTAFANDNTNAARGESEEMLLREMIHLSTGLPPTTQATQRCFAPAQATAPSTFSHITEAEADDGDDDNHLLREMIHLSTGLPPDTIATRRILSPSPSPSSGLSSDVAITGTATDSTTTSSSQRVRAASSSSSSSLSPSPTRSAPTTTTSSSLLTSLYRALSRAVAAEDNESEEDALLREMIHLSTGLPPTTNATRSLLRPSTSPNVVDSSSAAVLASPKNNAEIEDEDDAALLLRQMINYSMGLPPNTVATRGVFEKNNNLQQQQEGDAADDEASSSSSNLMNRMLANMMLLRRREEQMQCDNVSNEDTTPRNGMKRMTTMPNISPTLAAQQLSASFQKFAATMFPLSLGGGGGGSNATTPRRDRTSPEAIAARSRRAERMKAPNGIPEEMLGF